MISHLTSHGVAPTPSKLSIALRDGIQEVNMNSVSLALLSSVEHSKSTGRTELLFVAAIKMRSLAPVN